MRKSFDGLYELVGRCLLEQPTSGDLFTIYDYWRRTIQIEEAENMTSAYLLCDN